MDIVAEKRHILDFVRENRRFPAKAERRMMERMKYFRRIDPKFNQELRHLVEVGGVKKLDSGRKKRILCVELGVEYPSQAMAAEDLCLFKSQLSEHLNGLRPDVKGLTFQRVEDEV